MVAARSNLLDFTTYTKPDYEVNWHHRVVCSYLDEFAAGHIKRLMLFMPPQNGKSELVSRRLPAYILGRNPDAQVIACSYGSDLAQSMNRDVQRIIDDEPYQALFPGTKLFGTNIRTVASRAWLRNSDIFEVVGHKGVYRCAGVGGPITGKGMNYGIIDDPVKNRQDANSETIRASIWSWYTSTFYTRRRPNAGILLTVTRWHEDDLAGKLLALAKSDPNADQWTVVEFPALGEWDEKHPKAAEDPRQAGDALWPTRYDLADLAATRINVGSYDWNALYQQRPTPPEGGMFKRHWFDVVGVAPRQASRLRAWDKAGSDDSGDYTVGVLMARDSKGVYYVEDVIREQLSDLGREKTIKNTAAADKAKYGNVKVWIEQEPGSGGKDSARVTIRSLAGHDVHAERPTTDKAVRAGPFAAQCEAENVKLVAGDWNTAYLNELAGFPYGTHDDQCLVAGTLVATAMGDMPIEQVQIGDYVLTRQGYKRVSAAGMTSQSASVVTAFMSNGRSLTGTRNHPVYTYVKGFVPLDASSGYGIMTAWQNQKQSPIRGSFFDAIQSRKLSRIGTIIDHMQGIFVLASNTCTKKFGRMQTALFLKDIKSTTETVIRSIMSFQTWNVSPTRNTSIAMPTWELGRIALLLRQIWTEFDRSLKSGMAQPRGAHGTLSMGSNHGKGESQRPVCAFFAGRNLSPLPLEISTALSFVPSYAANARMWQWESTWLKNNALCAERHLRDSAGRQIAPVSVVRVQDGTDRRAVYNLSVEGASEYFANGVLVHNCDASALAFNKLTLEPQLPENIDLGGLTQQSKW